MFEKSVNNTKIILITGDITVQDVDAIVNAANSSLMGGGGVDGAIHRAGGPAILNGCKKIVEKIGSLPTGEAVITTGGNLPAKFVIHTVGPIWRGGNYNEDKLLSNAYINSLKVAKENNLKTVAFPSISTGAYRYPVYDAAEIAVKKVTDFVKKENHFKEIRFVLFNESIYNVYLEVLKNYSEI